MCDEARTVLRPRFLAADVGITGGNFLDRRDRLQHHRHQRGQRRPDADAAAHPHRHGQHRKGGADPGGCGDLAAAAGALGDRAGILVLHDGLDRSAAAGRPRRARAVPRRPARQRPQQAARRRIPRDAALPQMRGLHEPLPGLCVGRRARLWLGLSGPDGLGADPGAGRARRGRPSAECLDLLRALRERLSGQDPAAEDCCGIGASGSSPKSSAQRRPAPGSGCGGSSPAGRRCITPAPGSPRACWAGLGVAAGGSAACRSPRGWTRVRDMPAPEGRTFHQLWAERQKSARTR